jgi:diguanylate cyclase (GGDEF)-like protein
MSLAHEEGEAKAGGRRTPKTDRQVVLVVDDEPQMVQLIKRVLDRAGFDTISISDGLGAPRAAVESKPDIILLDVMLGSVSGDQVLAELRKDFRTRLIPIVFLTSRNSVKDKVEHLMAGADDYVTKPFISEELVARIRAVIARSTATRDLNPLTGMSGNSDILREISQRLAANDEFACLYPDIDNFKSYNDHYGFIRGDEVIKALASILLAVLEDIHSPQHFAGHIGGDDFVILTESERAEEIAAEFTKRFDEMIPSLYDPMDRDRGWIEFEDRTGNKHRTGLVSLSTGIVIARPGSFASAPALASRAAEVKGVAKRIPGSKWVVDRRRPPDTRRR